MEEKGSNNGVMKEAEEKNDLESCKVMDLDEYGHPCLIGCICGQIHDDKRDRIFWIQCDACGSWHYVSSDCLGFTMGQAHEMPFECSSCMILKYSEAEEKKSSSMERSGYLSSYHVNHEMNLRFNEIKLDFGKKCLARRMERRNKGYWEPVIQLSPYDIPPGELRDEWLFSFQKTNGKMKRLCYWYGSNHKEITFIPSAGLKEFNQAKINHRELLKKELDLPLKQRARLLRAFKLMESDKPLWLDEARNHDITFHPEEAMMSCILRDVHLRDEFDIAQRIFSKYLFAPFNSEHGISLSLDKPWGPNDLPFVNFFRNSVLRNYFGANKHGPASTTGTSSTSDRINERFTYGSGSGVGTVGTLPEYFVTRELDMPMQELCYKLWVFLKCQFPNFGNLDECFNHVTLLTYFVPKKEELGKFNRKRQSNCGFHTDNVYNPWTGKFQKKMNTQKEGTPTVILNLCDDREMQVKKRFVCQSTGKWKANTEKCKSFIMEKGSVFVLHPQDEQVLVRKPGEPCSQFMHGVYAKGGTEGLLSLALVFRRVTKIESYDSRGFLITSKKSPEDFHQVMYNFYEDDLNMKSNFNSFATKKMKK